MSAQQASVIEGQRVRLADALREMLICYAPHNDDFDRLAERFRLDTGFMAPGKDQPAAMGGDDNRAERRAAWNIWCHDRMLRLIESARKTLEDDGPELCGVEYGGSDYPNARCTELAYHRNTHVDDLFEFEWMPEASGDLDKNGWPE